MSDNGNTARVIKRSNGRLYYFQSTPFQFENGESIPELTVAYETYGRLNDDRSNVILIHHALSTHSHVASHEMDQTSGWWEEMVGPGKAIDTDLYFVICMNNLGSCFGSSGPASLNPATMKPYRLDFPVYTFTDIAESQMQVLRHLGITHLAAIIGSSVGAMVSMQMITNYPELADVVISISSCHKSYPSNIANRVIQRNMIQLDPDWENGYYTINPTHGLTLARKLGMFTYRSSEFDDRFEIYQPGQPVSDMDVDVSDVESYLQYNAEKFVKLFDTNTYLYLLKAMDLFDISQGQGSDHPGIKAIQAYVAVISVDTDSLFTPDQQADLYQLLKDAGVTSHFVSHESVYGHDTFLIETEHMGTYIRESLLKEPFHAK